MAVQFPGDGVHAPGPLLSIPHVASADKRIFCFCHWGGENVVNIDGSASYVGGVTESFKVNSRITYDAFTKIVFDRLGIEPLGKVLHFSVKYNKLQLIRLKDQDGLDNLIEFNDDFAHVYVSKCEPGEVAAPVSSCTRRSTTEVEAHHTQCSEERRVSRYHSTEVEAHHTQCSEEKHVSRYHSTEVEAHHTQCSEERRVSRDHSTSIPLTSLSDDVTPLAAASWGEILVGEGQAFENANAFRQALFKYAISKQFSYKLASSNSTYMSVRCTVNGCSWKVTLGREATGQWSIKTFVDSHTHSPLDKANFKPKFNSKMMVDIMQEKSLGSPSYLPREVCDDTKRNFAITLTYHQAWRAKKAAEEVIDGKVEDFYKLIPWLCDQLIKAMPGTIAKWSCTEDNRFKQIFVSYECSIRGFHVGCRPLIFIDVYPLSVPYRGTLLVASTLDANNGMYPLAYGVVTSENEEDWLWFLKHLKLVVQDREVVIVSDRNPSILSGVDKIFGEDNHAYCFHCVQENFRKFIATNHNFKLQDRGKEIALKYLSEIAYARTLDIYNEVLAKMCTFRKELYNWVITNGPERWSNALFKKPRWDLLNSNVMEYFDDLLGEARLLHIPEMMEAYREKLSHILQNKQSQIGNWKLPVGPRIEEKILENQKLGHSLVASIQSDSEFVLQDCHGREEVVNVKLSTCTCLEWQMIGIPCRHACRAIALTNMDVYQCVAGWYKREVQERIYAEVMHGVPKIDIRHPDEVGIAGVQMVESGSTSGNNVVLSPCPPRTAQNKRRRGRPRKEQIRPEVLDVKHVRCSHCNSEGHNRKTCKKTL